MEANCWLVLQSERWEDDGGLWVAATPFFDLDDAKAFLKHVIDDEWGPMKLEYPDGITRDVRLGDNPGYKYPESSSIKHSLVYFDDEGMEAWDMIGATEKKVKIVKSRKEGERVC